ncbi:MAG TPA: hypothetical protein VIQ00_14210 [Chitinophagaceae bacterium]
MAIKSNIPEIIEKLERIKAALVGPDGPPPAITEAMYTALNAGMGKMKFRIFNKGMDAEGNSLGNYHGNKTRITKKKLSIASDDEFDEKDRKKAKRNLNKLVKNSPDETYTEYEKFRVSRGRQIEYKDLEMEGSLRKTIEVVRVENGKVVIVIRNEETAKIAGYQEQQIGNIKAGQNAKTGTAEPAKIFTISQEEYELIKAEGNEAIRQIIQKIINEA